MSIRTNPSVRELRWFGLALLCFFSILGGMIAWRTGSYGVSKILWGCGLGLTAAYYAMPPLRRPIFVGWMTLTYPIGWFLTHATLALIYYGMFTPIGLLSRLIGRDTMRRKSQGAETYWIRRPKTPPASRYFRQF